MSTAAAASLDPMLARLSRELPVGDFIYEPKWDGFRCVASVRGGEVDLRSRNRRPLARYFPEVVEALRGLGEDLVLDGELVIVGPAGFDFAALLGRLHPAASRVERLRMESPATFIAFDLLEVREQDLCARPFVERREWLARVLSVPSPHLRATPATTDHEVARTWLDRYVGRGIDGVVAKAFDLTYQPGRRAMLKVKNLHTVDCVLAGLRMQAEGPLLGSLLLGMYDGDGGLRHVGVSSTFTVAARRALLAELAPLVTGLDGHPWQDGFGIGRSPMGRLAGSAGRWEPETMSLDWTPLVPVRVAEVAYDQLDGERFRHPARFVRWRPDRDARSCGLEQLAPAAASVGEVLQPR